MTDSAGAGAVFIRLHDLSLALESESAAFSDYVRTAMARFLCDPVERPDFRSRLEWVDGAPGKSLEDAFGSVDWQRRPDRDLYLSDDRAYWLRIDDFADLQMMVSRDAETLCVTGRYYFQVGRERWLEPLRRLRYRGQALQRLQARRFSTLLYYLVYYPLLWRLSRHGGWHLLHGGAVGTDKGALVFTGMPGCGKSTLSVALLSDPRRRMLSDNLVLHDGKRIMACPELLLLDAGSVEIAGEGARRLEPVGERRVFGRFAYRPDVTELRPQTPLAVFNVGRAARTDLVDLSPEECASRVIGAGIMAKEVRRMAIMAEVLDCVTGTARPDAAAALSELLSSVPCYELWIGEGACMRSLIEESLMPAVERAATLSGTVADE